MNKLFQTISEIQPKLRGWCSPEKAIALASAVVTIRPEISVEIGVYSGSSFIPIALAHKAVGHGYAIGIDAWDKDVMQREYKGQHQHQEWWSKIDQDKIYSEFMSQIVCLELTSFVKIIRKESRFVQPPSTCGLLHIDGGHSDTAISDAVRFSPHVQVGGIIVCDDTDGGHGPMPALAEKNILTMGFKRLYGLGTGSVLQRII
jgi:hypothetical protein